MADQTDVFIIYVNTSRSGRVHPLNCFCPVFHVLDADHFKYVFQLPLDVVEINNFVLVLPVAFPGQADVSGCQVFVFVVVAAFHVVDAAVFKELQFSLLAGEVVSNRVEQTADQVLPHGGSG